MNTQVFYEHFEQLTDAPNAVVRLRELILQLAVQGKLVEQDERDEPAARLLGRIEAERKQLVRVQKIKEAKPLPLVSDDEAPFELPNSWEWIRIGEAMNLINGRAFKPSDWNISGVPIVRIQNLNSPDAPFNFCNFAVEDKFYINDFDLLISWSGTPGTSFGAFIWERGRAVLNQHIFRAELYGEAHNKEFLRLAINARLDEMIAKAHGGVGLQHITKGKLEALPLPLPPFEEQKRIVAKVDELMRLCDELEQKQMERREARSRLNRAALDQLISARDAAELQERWRSVSEHFSTLTTTPEQIDKLRQTILQLAVQGSLTPQSSKGKHISGRRVLDHIKILNGYAFKSEWFVRGGVRLLRNVNVGHGSLRWNDVVSIPTEQAKEFSRFALAEGDIVISLDRPIIATGVKVARVSSKDLPSLLLQRVGKVEFKTDSVDPEFFLMWLHSPLFINSIDPGRSNGVPHISSKSIEALSLTLPPVSEQKRIVAKVNELTRLCDELEANLRRSEMNKDQLLRAAVRSMLAANNTSDDVVETAELAVG